MGSIKSIKTLRRFAPWAIAETNSESFPFPRISWHNFDCNRKRENVSHTLGCNKPE